MPRTTLQYWLCWRSHKNEGATDKCSICGANRRETNAQVHASERAVVYYNPASGEHRTPARADQPVPEIYARQGFERREILNMTAWEKEAGVAHEDTNFNPGNEPSPERYNTTHSINEDVKKELIQEVSAAITREPGWTGAENLPDIAPEV